MKALLIFTIITLCSCSSYEPKTYRVTTTTWSCPRGYYLEDRICHLNIPSYPSFKPANSPLKPLIHKKHIIIKPNKPKAAKIACSEVYDMVNKCMTGDLK